MWNIQSWPKRRANGATPQSPTKLLKYEFVIIINNLRHKLCSGARIFSGIILKDFLFKQKLI